MERCLGQKGTKGGRRNIKGKKRRDAKEEGTFRGSEAKWMYEGMFDHLVVQTPENGQ